MQTNSKERFSSRVEKYVRYRPGYSAEIVELLKSECGLRPEHVIADIASGTGIFTRLLLENGNHVYGVEPNAEMRRSGEEFLARYPHFSSIAASAEDTTLAGNTIDFVTIAQAAHWFDRDRARREFARILKPEGWCVLVWNSRRVDSSEFQREYERLISTYSGDYKAVRHEHTTGTINEFFSPATFQSRDYTMRQEFDYQGLEGRLLSSSYTPQPGDPHYEPMLCDLRRVFDAHQIDGRIILEYDTHVYYSQLSRKSPTA